MSDDESPATIRMRKCIQRAFDESQKFRDSDTPAIDAIVVLRGLQTPVRGALSTTPEGLLKLLAPAGPHAPDVLLEHFFDYADVVAFVMMRTAKPAERSRIVTQ